MKISFLGNFEVDYSSESQYVKTLEKMGHEVAKLQEGQIDSKEIYESAEKTDLFIWVHTHGWVTPGLTSMGSVLNQLKENGVPTITYHLDLWKGLDREKDLEEDPFYKQIGHFFATDRLMADWFNENTEVKGHYLPAGVFEEEVIMLDPQSYMVKGKGPNKIEYFSQNSPTLKERPKDVIFVGSRNYHSEYPYRQQLITWLEETYEDRFGHYSGEEGALGLKRGLHLNQLLADTKIVVGDSLCLEFDYPYYWSDRVYEIMGRGGFLIMPYIQGLEKQFEEGKEIIFYEYGDFSHLKQLIDYYLVHDSERERIRKNGFELVKSRDTYTHRWQTIFNELGLK